MAGKVFNLSDYSKTDLKTILGQALKARKKYRKDSAGYYHTDRLVKDLRALIKGK